MSLYVAKRILYLLPILIGVTFITFAVAQVIPGDPARMAAAACSAGAGGPCPVPRWHRN